MKTPLYVDHLFLEPTIRRAIKREALERVKGRRVLILALIRQALHEQRHRVKRLQVRVHVLVGT